jgi:hypothetical protein
MSKRTKRSRTATSTDGTAPEAATTEATGADESSEVRKPLTIMVPERLGSRLRLVAAIEGVTLSSIFLSAVEKSLGKRLSAALERVKEDPNVSGE